MKTAERLKTGVEPELRWETSVKAERIGVSVTNGVVELDGHVKSFYEKWGAEPAALRVANVKSIASKIAVDLSSATARTGPEIAHAAANNLNWNYSLPESVKVKVSDGWVTLSGVTEWHYQREEAARVIRSLLGVKGVSNDIQLKPTVGAASVSNLLKITY